ncbi:MAG: hypothetical protein F4Z75_06835 [Synechococcus sp. SB0668_bin_15]|nr:hypothetical protein [Synechococcus sp. SB0668_bin_15]MYA91424.1 hypothetical protein [Synechococcus sp. SB0663_bin_10]MYC49681.1 hypothetical protein [Synechococcus sp. SB0662_bin_14]MYG47548.1 hypothetical protein [Synechococcus sp. SB0675_bin_6]MYJ59188.1 hypothetical protein [Synechococcus sp. SB0672_bin_6]
MDTASPLLWTLLVEAGALMMLVYVPTRIYLSFTEVMRQRSKRKQVLESIRQLRRELQDPFNPPSLAKAD